MSLRNNVIANFIGQGYAILVSILMLPFYLQYLGAEAYGLVGFFAVMQAWFGLLDMGMSQTLSRQVAHLRGGETTELGGLYQLVRSIELLFAAFAIIVILGIYAASNWISTQWLTVQSLSQSEVAYCITLMGFIIGLRWFASLYKSGIQGMEKMVWLNGANIMLATLRYVAVYVLLRWVTQEPRHFFEFQVAVSLVELGVVATKFYRLMPDRKGRTLGFSWKSVKPVIPFTAGIAYTSALWILLTQLDKLILSHVLNLKEYGYFAVVTVISNGLLILTTPISQAILPRMTLLVSQGNEETMLSLYHRATKFVTVIIFPLAGIMALFSTELLYAWTGDRAAADWAGPVLRWFVLGNAILSIAAFQYYLQFANGRLKMHVINTTINAVLQVPILVYVAFNYGAIGVAYAWFIIRLIAFLIWPAIVHKQYRTGLHSDWLFKDILPSLIVTCLVVVFISIIKPFIDIQYRLEMAVAILIALIVCFGLNILASSTCRSVVVNWTIQYASTNKKNKIV